MKSLYICETGHLTLNTLAKNNVSIRFVFEVIGNIRKDIKWNVLFLWQGWQPVICIIICSKLQNNLSLQLSVFSGMFALILEIIFSRPSMSNTNWKQSCLLVLITTNVKVKRSGPEGSTNLIFPDLMTTAQDGGKVVSLMHRPHLPPENTPGIHFC